MSELVELLVRVAGWVYWLAWAAALGSAGASFLFMALGDRDRAVTFFKGSIAAILVAAFGQTILLSVIGVLGGWQAWSAQAELTTRYPGAGTVVYVLAFTLLLLAAVNLARGRVEEGGWMIVGSVLALALVVFAANALNTTVMPYGGGPLLIEARTNRAMYEPGQQVFLYVTVRASGLAVSTVDLTVDWGDGTTTRKTGVPVGREVVVCYREGVDPHDPLGTPRCEGKKYELRRGEEASFYTIRVEAVAQAGGSRLTGTTYVTVYVRQLPGLAFPFSVLGGFLSWLMNLLTGGMLDPTRLFYAPVFRLDGPEGEWYRTVLTASIALLPVFLLFRIAPGLAYDPGRAVVDGFRDAAFAVVAMILIPHAYNVTAGALNTFTEMLMGPAGAAIVSQMAGTAIAWAAIFIVVSLVSPGVGFLGTLILITVLMVAALASLRWFLLLALIATSPFLVLAWLHPYLRGAVDTAKGLAGAMLVAGPVAAMFTLLFSKVMLGENVLQQLAGSFALSWLGVFIIGLLPQLVSGLAVTGLGSTLSHRLESAVTTGAPQVGKAALVGSAKGLAAGAAVAGRAGYAQAMRVKPLADVMRAGGTMIGKAREAVSRTLDRVQTGLENRMARAQRMLTRDQARLETWRGLERDFERFAALDEAYREAERRHAEALEYYDANPGDTYAGAALFLAREEHERLKAEREAERERLEEKVRQLRELNVITGDDYRMLMAGVREAGAVPAITLQYARKRVKDYEELVEVDRAQLMAEEAVDKPIIDLVKWTREAPKRAWQNLRQSISKWLGQRKELGKRRAQTT